MFLQTYGVAVAIILASAALGQAICAASGIRGLAWAAPLVGLAALIIVAGATIKLPGRAVTADVIGIVVVLLAVAYLIFRKQPLLGPAAACVVIFTLFAVSIPFLANGRVGLQGVSLDNDTAAHLLWAEDVRSPHMASMWGIAAGYPLGPHSLVAALGTLLRIPLDAVFAGFLVAIAPLTSVAGMGVLGAQATWRRMVVGVLSALVFLVAAYYGEGAFKETLMAGFLLAFVVHLEQVRRPWSGIGDWRRWWQLTPAVVLVAGAVYAYSYVAIGWFAVTIGLWALAEVVARPGRALRLVSRRNLVLTAMPLAVAVVALVVLLLPIAGQILTFFHGLGAAPTSLPAPLGNLAGPLSPYEMFGISNTPDFRFVLDNFHAGEVAAFSTAVVIYGFLWSLRRRDLLLPAAATGALLLWWISHRGPSPYVAAKAMVIASPLLMALSLKALLTRTPGERVTRVARLTIALAFCTLAGWTSLRSLRDAPVQSSGAGQNLAAFHDKIGQAPVLFLGFDDYAGWLLRDARVDDPTGASAFGVVALPRPNKPPSGLPGQAIDFDSIRPSDLDHFPYVVTTSSPYNSQPYPNFHRIAHGRFYDLWERTGRTIPRAVIEPSGAPGTIMDCRKSPGRSLKAEHGVAAIVPTAPIVVGGPSLPAGGVATVALHLPRGRWELSMQYMSDFKIALVAPHLQLTMPAYLGRVGPYFAIGSVTGQGRNSPIVLAVSIQHPSFFTSSFDNLFAEIPTIAATRVPDTRKLVPLSHACGKYVDWYRLT